MSPTCYACDEVATTVEHVPPRSFFPIGSRKDLLTVPSCEAHNNDLSKDVEYVRNIIPLVMGTNDTGHKHFVNKVLPSFDRSPALKAQTFRDLREVDLGGGPAGIFTVDLVRLTRVMEAILAALYFRETGQKNARWAVIPSTMLHRPNTPKAARETWNRLLATFDLVVLSERACANPNVFRYSSGSNPSPMVGTFWFYQLSFYDGFVVKGFTLPSKSTEKLSAATAGVG